MTEPDTSAEAVERLALTHDQFNNTSEYSSVYSWPMKPQTHIKTSVTLRALAAERDALKARAEAAEAEVAGIRAALSPPDGWPLVLAARAAKQAAEAAGAEKRSAYAAGLEAAAKAAEDCLNVRCAKCSHPRDNHPYRHPFVASCGTDPATAIRALIAEGKP